MTPIDPRIIRGAAALDEHGPKDWRRKVIEKGPFTKDTMPSMECVLGRVFGSLRMNWVKNGYGGSLEHYGFNGLLTAYGSEAGWEEAACQWNRILGMEEAK